MSAECVLCGELFATGARHSCVFPPTDFSPGDVIDNRYWIGEEIGHGGMGIVYRARDLGLDRVIAIKVIAQSISQRPDFVQLFRREAAALAAIRSNHVVQI